jgi:hypothetical protein
MELGRVVERLSDPTAYPEPTTGVELVQTHISWIFLTDRFAYKIKKPVDFGFLDYTTLEKRRACCEREVILNRRLCPDTYLGVTTIADVGGTPVLDGPGSPIEVAVKMARLPEERMLRKVLSRGEGETELFVGLARTVADFHERARVVGESASLKDLEGVRFNCEENFSQTERYVGSLLSPQEFDLIRNSTRLFFDRRAALFSRRTQEGRIVDGHGDLHLDSICATEPLRIFDCIEFNERFRIQDVAEEVAFLAMDLEFNGYAPFARTFVEAYAHASGDRELFDLLAFYKCYRAYVRAKVNSFLADDPNVSAEKRDAIRATASRYYDLAARYATVFNPRRLIMTCGLTGSGKSTLARRLAERYRLRVVRSDVTRKELLGLAPDTRRHVPFNEGEYSPSVTEQTYATMVERAAEGLTVGETVILDGCFTKKDQRVGAVGLARHLGVPLLVLECRTSEEVIRQRLEQRARKAAAVSDGRWEIYRQQIEEFEPADEISGDERVIVDRSRPVEELLEELTAVVPPEWHDVREIPAAAGQELPSAETSPAALTKP